MWRFLKVVALLGFGVVIGLFLYPMLNKHQDEP